MGSWVHTEIQTEQNKKRATVEVRGDCNGGEMRALIPEGCEGL